MNKHLRIGFTGKCISPVFQLTPQHRIVFDDAVVNKRDGFVLGEMRVGIDGIGFAMGSPAGVGHADVTGDIFPRYKCFKVRNFSFTFENPDIFVEQADPCAVITPVF